MLINNVTHQVNLRFGFVSSDSLAASSLLGIKYGFNHSYCCRFCKCNKLDFPKISSEDQIELKDQNFYNEAASKVLSLDDNQDYFGQQAKSCFRFFNIDNFYEFFPPCIDHDIFECILPKLIKFSLKYFDQANLMSLSSFDAAVRNFKFKGKDRESFPTINFKILKNLRFTASEGYTFSRFYLIFLEQIPPDDNVMNILFIFIKII